jgi:hypothetical protein
VSITAFADPGFTRRTLLGEMASMRFWARNRICWPLRQASAASSTSPATAIRRSIPVDSVRDLNVLSTQGVNRGTRAVPGLCLVSFI